MCKENCYHKQGSRSCSPIHAFFCFSILKLSILLLEEIVERGPKVFEVIERHTEAAAAADLVDIYDDDGPCAGYGLDVVEINESRERFRAVLDHPAYCSRWRLWL